MRENAENLKIWKYEDNKDNKDNKDTNLDSEDDKDVGGWRGWRGYERTRKREDDAVREKVWMPIRVGLANLQGLNWLKMSF